MEKYIKTFIVRDCDTAKIMGSGDLEVLATPAMVAMIENTAKEAISSDLTEKESSVGSFIETKHLKPSKVGAEITVQVIIDSREEKKVNFSFEVFDGNDLIGNGNHQRVVILTELLNRMNNLT
ncbi:thioesterase family protein [Enterococcus rivorum]|uniref:thioesterase family protein n=1 Tax=Enterococcus rivorum TaxID=762845 RepID=UPI003632BDF7